MQPTGVAFPKSNPQRLLFLLSNVEFCHNNNGFIWLTGFEKFPAAVSNYYNLMIVSRKLRRTMVIVVGLFFINARYVGERIEVIL